MKIYQILEGSKDEYVNMWYKYVVTDKQRLECPIFIKCYLQLSSQCFDTYMKTILKSPVDRLRNNQETKVSLIS